MDAELGNAGTETLCEVCYIELDRVSEVAQLADRELDLLKQPKRRVNVNIPVRMDDGSIEVFPSFRIQWSFHALTLTQVDSVAQRLTPIRSRWWIRRRREQ
jgi:hypothetical protein